METCAEVAVRGLPNNGYQMKRLASCLGLILEELDFDEAWYLDDARPLSEEVIRHIREDADSFAFSSGEYASEIDAPMPECLLPYKNLADAFERGKAYRQR